MDKTKVVLGILAVVFVLYFIGCVKYPDLAEKKHNKQTVIIINNEE